MKNALDMLKGSDKFETAENISLTGVLLGAVVLSSGIALSALSYKGVPAILSMMGSLIAFLFTVILIFVWIAKSFTK